MVSILGLFFIGFVLHVNGGINLMQICDKCGKQKKDLVTLLDSFDNLEVCGECRRGFTEIIREIEIRMSRITKRKKKKAYLKWLKENK